MQSYAVTWQEDGGPLRSGKLELQPAGLTLDGSSDNGSGVTVVPYPGLVGMGVARSAERITGRPTLLLYRRARSPLKIASVAAPSIITEVSEQLASFQLDQTPARSRLIVVVPLKEGVRDAVASLIGQGPPFDPEEAGLERHLAFLTDDEAIFLFESGSAARLERLLAETNLWSSAAAWRPFVAGPPRVAQPAYSWARSAEPNDLSFTATPGPGDSEGGDIYPP